jgi:uncharacterized repeat protein (TIGR03806 family)
MNQQHRSKKLKRSRRLAAKLSLLASAGVILAGHLLAPRTASAQITRVANSTLQMPSNPAATYTMTTAFTGLTFTAPLAFATPPGETNRLFVVERAGRIKVIPNLNSPTSSTFLDISARVTTAGEEGMVGLAFHPNYASNGFFYVFYTTNVGGGRRERLSRFKVSASANVADAASEQVMIEQIDDYSNHQGGDLHFGPDGYLYVSLGDEGGGNDSGLNTQTITKDFFSGMLRIDVDKKPGSLTPNPHASFKTGTYAIPADNPYVGVTTFNGLAVDPTKVRTEFWAVGLRNPFRFTFDSATNKLWCADVGQDAREEIDIIEKGKNYGWAFREGFIATAKPAPAGVVATDPIWDYDHTLGKSIIGGVVYHGNTLVELGGAYIYADYVSGNLWALQGAPGSYNAVKLGAEAGISAFGIDPRNGDVLISNVTGNTVKRLVRASGGGVIPTKLSGTGIFSSLSTLTPNPGIVAYAPAVPFWSDNAIKTRWFSIPNVADKVTFASDSNWTLPTGAVWVKHFDIEMEKGNPASKRRLETRVLVKTASGGYGVTYKWNAAGTDADLVADAGADEVLNVTVNGVVTPQTWRYPARNECSACHTSVGGFALSFNTRQLNTTYPYQSGSANQITALSNAGYFTATVGNVGSLPTLSKPDDLSASIELRARSYLQVNCAQCHQPGGTGLGAWDARVSVALSSANIVNGALNDNGGDSANRVLVPSDAGHSMLLRRIQNLPNAPRMPPIGSNVLDQASIALVTQWVNSIVPSTDFTYEAEALTRTSTGATTTASADAPSSGGTWIALNADGVDDYVEFTVPTLGAGTYALKMAYKAHPNRGILSLKVDGVQLGATLDEYATTTTYKETSFGNVTFATSASHIIRLTVTGKNAAAGAYTLAADKFTLTGQGGPPPSAPSAPASLTATPGNGQVALAWTASSGATSYTVKWSTTSGGPYTSITGLSSTSYTHTGRTNGTTYYYVVSASNANGESPNSAQASATPQPPPPPAAPSGLSATAGNGQVVLSWTASAGATSYTVKASLTSGGPYDAFTQAGITATTFTNGGLANDTTYYYVVSASNATGEGADSGEQAATPHLPPPPGAPATLLATAGNAQVALSWTASGGATGYTVKRSLTAGGPYDDFVQSVAGTSFTNVGLVNGTTYFYVVSANNAGGESANSAEKSATPQLPPPPAAPTNLAATAGNGQIVLTWIASGGATSYTVKRASITGGPYTDFVQPGVAGTTYTNTGLVNGTTYYYVVTASNANGESANSAEKSATPVAPTAAISNLVVNDTATTNPPAGTDGIANSLQWSIQTNFQVDVVAFGDRTVKVTAVPTAGNTLLGKAWIRTAADSKNYAGAPLATFTSGGSSVYVAVDNRHNGTGTKPTWLDATWVDQGYDITITEGTTARPYSVYRKTVMVGSTVTLPTINSPTAPCYIVIVQ